VAALQTVLSGAALGDPAIVVHGIDAAQAGHRLRGAPNSAPLRLRMVARSALGFSGRQSVLVGGVRDHIVPDLAGDIGALLASGATFDGNPLTAGDIAIIVESHADARRCYAGLVEAGIPAVYTGDSNIFTSAAAADWLCVLDAFDQTHRSSLVRAAATTAFFGETVESLAREDDTLTDRVADTLRGWADHARGRGVAAVFEAANVAGMSRRVLETRGGERMMTDLAHIAQLLQEIAHRNQYGVPTLRDWLRDRCTEQRKAERNRRLDSDAAGVQVMTVWASKGLQYPIVYLPFTFNRNIQTDEVVSYHDEAGTRCLYVGGERSADFAAAERQGWAEDTRERLRLAYVALTRAQSQVVVWWAPTRDEVNGGLSRLLRGRAPGDPAEVPDICRKGISDADARAHFEAWQRAGGPMVEDSVVRSFPALATTAVSTDLGVRHFHRHIDTSWRRTS
jgi:exodeoxyribonuclease V beta subunit